MFRFRQSLGLTAAKNGLKATPSDDSAGAKAGATDTITAYRLNADCPSGDAPSAFLRRRRRRRARLQLLACPTEPGRSWR